MSHKERRTVPAEAIELYNQYVHGEISRRAFLSRAQQFAVAGFTATTLVQALMPDYADFFSFGTNDLTQLTWAFSRDDVESTFLPRYLDLELLPFNPFESLDQDGVGLLVKIARDQARAVRADFKLGVCGEHGGDPRSIHFFHNLNLDYVSCSPFRVPVARLESGRAKLLKS